MKKATCCLLGFFLGAPLSATELETIQVTASRFAETVDETLTPVTVISREDIEQGTARDLPELLQSLPGISIAQSGGPGQNASLFLRGTESDHTLVLIDGVRIGSVSTGAAALQYLPLEQIEKIEIVRGPRSSLYGSEAIGGVIHIFTRKGKKFHGSLSGGSYQTVQGDLGYSLAGENTSADFTVAGKKTDGINALKGSNPDKDDYENTSVSAHVNHRFSDTTRFHLNVLHARGKNDFDNPSNLTSKEHSDFVQQSFQTRLDFAPSGKFDASVSLGQSRDKLETQGSSPRNFNTTINQFTIQGNYAITDNHFLATGVDYRDDRLKSSTAFDKTSRDNVGVFAVWRGGFGQHDLNLGLRHDDNEAFGGHTTGSLEYGFHITEQYRLTAAYGTAFKTPTFNDLYFPNSAFFVSNPDLDPETSESFEAGIRGNHDKFHWNLHAFHTSIEDLIAYTSDPVTFVGTMDNIDEAEINGVELVAGTKIKGHQIEFGYTWTDTEDKKTGQPLLRRPENTAQLNVSRDIGNFSASINLSYHGSSEDLDFSSFPAQRVKLDAYTLLNLGMQYQLTKQWKLFAKFNNLLDEDYETVLGYNQPGFNGYLGVRFNQ